MKTIAINSIKDGTGKSTLSVLLVDALLCVEYRCLGIDADASNSSLSLYFWSGALTPAKIIHNTKA
jgi:MinD-like ATPase involved in chromosome partitioning or flagellar assembly